MSEAAARRDEREKHFQAAMIANLMNCWLARNDRVTPEQLLGLKRKDERPGFAEMDEAGKEAALERVRKKLEARKKLKAGKKQRHKKLTS